MRKSTKKDRKNREMVYKWETLRFVLISISQNKNFPLPVRLNAGRYLASLKPGTSKTRLTKRCVVSTRRNVSCYKFKFSRLVLARIINTKTAFGITKAAW